jgi:RNA polymerase sigma-70 factor (ECF subfamily)
MASPRDIYLAALPETVREAWEREPRLEEVLATAFATARHAFPSLAIDESTFVAYLAARVDVTEAASLRLQHAPELYLACAVVHGDPSAMALFEERYVVTIGAQVARYRLSPDELDEVKQRVRHQFLVSEAGRPPRLADYSGRGALGAWLHVAANRVAYKLKRSLPDGGDDRDLEHLASAGPTPEGEVLTDEGRAAFGAAFREAIGSLEPLEQNVIRQHYLDGLTLDQLGALHQAHRTTVAYWLKRARERLLRRTRQGLLKRRLAPAEVDSLLGQARGRFAITMRSLFSK